MNAQVTIKRIRDKTEGAWPLKLIKNPNRRRNAATAVLLLLALGVALTVIYIGRAAWRMIVGASADDKKDATIPPPPPLEYKVSPTTQTTSGKTTIMRNLINLNDSDLTTTMYRSSQGNVDFNVDGSFKTATGAVTGRTVVSSMGRTAVNTITAGLFANILFGPKNSEEWKDADGQDKRQCRKESRAKCVQDHKNNKNSGCTVPFGISKRCRDCKRNYREICIREGGYDEDPGANE
jgi:hypothetical protein